VNHRGLAALAAAALVHAVGFQTIAAQTTGTLDLGGSWVDYEGFLGSAAVSLTPTVQYDAPTVSLGATGSLVVFESGNHILQALAAASWRTPAIGSLRGEVSGVAGANKYEEASTFTHALARSRIHVTRTRAGGWVGAATGQSSFSGASGTPFQIEAGLWAALDRLALDLTATRTWFDEIEYADVVGSARLRELSVTFHGSIRARTWSANGGEGLYGEIRAEIPIWRRLVALVGGGRYPSDPARGVLAANYASVGLRVSAVQGRPRLSSQIARTLTRSSDEHATLVPGQARIEVRSVDGGAFTLRVRAPGAESVDLAGDFTDWNPVALTRVNGDVWEVQLPGAPGLYRVNVRLNQGDWMVPRGLRAAEDEFGGLVGILVIAER
jgi:hypothetical protein